MDAEQILDLIRPLVVVVDGVGTLQEVHGGYGGFLGFDLDAMVGTSVFDSIAPDEVDELATYFLESAGESLETVALPLPFRVTVVGGDGRRYPADVIPATAEDDDTGGFRWVVVIVPLQLGTSVSRSLDAEVAGASHDEVRAMLTDELTVDNDFYTTRWFLIDLLGDDDGVPPAVATSRPEDGPVADAIAEAAGTGTWAPWSDVDHGDTVAVDLGDAPEGLADVAAARGWRRCSTTPVHVDGVLVAAYVLLGRVPTDYDVMTVHANVVARSAQLAGVTGLLIDRWRDRDRLIEAATTDPLTGLANRDALADALDDVGARTASLLYIDVDHFKAVNDDHGHEAGDRSLVRVGEMIVAGCRPEDLVARVGGDEFVVLLRGASLAEATTIGKRLVSRVAEEGRDPSSAIPGVTISIGLAPVAGNPDPMDAADRAMLTAKRMGRSRIVSAPAAT